MPTIHQRLKHPEPIPGCRPCVWATVRLHEVGVPQAAADRILQAKRDEFEVDAYRKLRAQGVQPEGSYYPELLEARNKTRLRNEPYDFAADDGSRDFGTRESLWTQRDGIGDVDVPPIEVKV